MGAPGCCAWSGGVGALLVLIAGRPVTGCGAALLASLLLLLFFSLRPRLEPGRARRSDASRWLMATGYLLIGGRAGTSSSGAAAAGCAATGRFLNVAAVALLVAFNLLRVANYASASAAAARRIGRAAG